MTLPLRRSDDESMVFVESFSRPTRSVYVCAFLLTLGSVLCACSHNEPSVAGPEIISSSDSKNMIPPAQKVDNQSEAFLDRQDQKLKFVISDILSFIGEDSKFIYLSVSRGHVFLKGQMNTSESRKKLLDAISSLKGVRSLDHEIQIVPSNHFKSINNFKSPEEANLWQVLWDIFSPAVWVVCAGLLVIIAFISEGYFIQRLWQRRKRIRAVKIHTSAG